MMQTIISLILTSCLLLAQENKEPNVVQQKIVNKQFLFKDNPQKKAATKSIDTTTKELKQKFDLQCVGVGVGGNYEELGLEFGFYHPLKKEEARRILLKSAEIFEKNLKKFQWKHKDSLKKYPASITVYSTDKQYRPYTEPFICVACISSKRVYFRFKEEGQEFGYKETIEETIEEAEIKNQEYLERIKDNKRL